MTGVSFHSSSQPLLILTGPPGAGKTTVAHALMTATTPAVHVRGDGFWGFIESGWVPPHLPGSEHQNRVVVAALGAATSEYSVGGYVVVLDAIIGSRPAAPAMSEEHHAAPGEPHDTASPR